MYYTKNVKHAADKMRWTVEELEMRILKIDDVSRKVLEAHWGLTGDGKRHQFKTIDRMLGIIDSREVYEKAVIELIRARYIEFLIDADLFSNTMAANLGNMARYIFPDGNSKVLANGTVRGAEILNALKTLTPREERVLTLYFGLMDEGSQYSLNEIAKMFNVTYARIEQIALKALRKMRHPSRAMLILHSESQQSEQKTPRVYPEHGSIEELDLSVRIFNCLMRAGVKTIEEFRVMSLDDVTKIRNLSDKCIEKISEIRSDMGVPLK